MFCYDFIEIMRTNRFSLCLLALSAIKTGAKQGNAADQYRLGWNYRTGNDVGPDEEVAMKWFHKAADQNHLKSQVTLGYIYLEGNGVAQNSKAAFKWFQKAAAQNSPQGEFLLGKMHLNGSGTEPDVKEAMRWFHKAGRKGNRIHEEGREVKWNVVEAYKFYILAERGDAIKRLAKSMTPAQISEAVKYAVDF